MECHQIATEGDLGGKSLSLTTDTAVVADYLSLSQNGESEGPSVLITGTDKDSVLRNASQPTMQQTPGEMECHQIATEGDLGGQSLSLTSDTAVVADFFSLSPNGESEGPVTTIDEEVDLPMPSLLPSPTFPETAIPSSNTVLITGADQDSALRNASQPTMQETPEELDHVLIPRQKSYHIQHGTRKQITVPAAAAGAPGQKATDPSTTSDLSTAHPCAIEVPTKNTSGTTALSPFNITSIYNGSTHDTSLGKNMLQEVSQLPKDHGGITR